MNLLIINGPNLNLLGKREPHLYGSQSFEDFLGELRQRHAGHVLDYFQSNHEGDIIDRLQEANGAYGGVVLNAASYSHSSVGIADAIAAIDTPVVELHISNVWARESFRHHSMLSAACIGVISGLGLQGYDLALQALISRTQ